MKTLSILAVIVFCSLSVAQDECVVDLEAAARLVEVDYAGFPHARLTLGGRIEARLSEASGKAKGASGAKCDAAIRGYLALFGDGHLLLVSDFSPAVDLPPPLFGDDRRPVARVVSPKGFLIRAPSFALGYKPDVEALVVEHEQAMRSRDLLVVDLRGNGGGADSTWTNLIQPIYTDSMRRWPIRWRPTVGNALAIDEQVRQLREALETSPAACDAMQQIAKSMRESAGRPPMRLGLQLPAVVSLPQTWGKPRRVAILVDGSCASSCENFLLAARQSSKVTVFGQPTYGAIDFQNIRIAALPSGHRQLRLAMSISERVLELGHRERGLAPDRELSEELLRDPSRAVDYVLQALRTE